MTALMLQVLKINVIAALMICAAACLGHFTKGRYSSRWKYCTWFMIMLFLLLPVNLENALWPGMLQIQIGRNSEAGAENLDVKELDTKSTGIGTKNGVDIVNEKDVKNEAGIVNAKDTEHEAGIVNEKDSEHEAEIVNAKDTEHGTEIVNARMTKTESVENSSDIYINPGNLPIDRILNIAGIVWLCGILMLCVERGLRYYFSLHKMERWSYPADNEEMQELYFRICRKKHIKNPPRLLIWEGLTSPMLAGLRNPGLYVPEKAFTLEELEFIFSHELSHYERHDLWYKMLMLVVTTIYWFNPALYWMQREAEMDIENLCDGKMAAHYSMKDRMKYGELLLKIAAGQNHIPYMSVGFSDGKKIFKNRILYMKNLRCLKEKIFPAIVLGIVMIGSQVLVNVSFEAVQAAAEEMTGISAGGEDFVNMVADNESDRNHLEQIEAEMLNGENLAATDIGRDHRPQSEEDATELVGIAVLEDLEDSGESHLNAILNKDAAGNADGAGNIEGIGNGDRTGNAGTMNNGADNSSSTGNTGSVNSSGNIGNIGNTGNISNAGNTDNTKYNTAEASGLVLTDEQKTLWAQDGSWASYVYRATNGNWYDGSGRLYYEEGGGNWSQAATGASLTENAPAKPSDSAVGSTQVTDDSGYNSQTLYENADGSWMNDASGVYVDNGDGTFTGPDGMIWYQN